MIVLTVKNDGTSKNINTTAPVLEGKKKTGKTYKKWLEWVFKESFDHDNEISVCVSNMI